MLKNEVYDILKTMALLVLPALAAFVGTVGVAINFQYTDIAVIIINASAVFLGSVLKISTTKYNAQ